MLLVGLPIPQSTIIPPALRNIVDVNLDRYTIIYEVEITKDSGLEIIQGNGYAVVGNITKGCVAEKLGIVVGDIITATSATVGNQLWTHDSIESIKSALSTRFVLYPTVTIRLERSLNSISPELKSLLWVPYTKTVTVRRPLGLHVVDGDKNTVYIQHMKEDCGAAKSKRLEIGDQIVAMSASWGDQMWTINSVESFIISVRMHTNPMLSLRIKRLVPLDVYMDQIVTARIQRQVVRNKKSQPIIDVSNNVDNRIASKMYMELNRKEETVDESNLLFDVNKLQITVNHSVGIIDETNQFIKDVQNDILINTKVNSNVDSKMGTKVDKKITNRISKKVDNIITVKKDVKIGTNIIGQFEGNTIDSNFENIIDHNNKSRKTTDSIDNLTEISEDNPTDSNIYKYISALKTKQQIIDTFIYLSKHQNNPLLFNAVVINKLMSTCILNEESELAIEIFEKVFGYRYIDSNPARVILNSINSVNPDIDMESLINVDEKQDISIDSGINSEIGRKYFDNSIVHGVSIYLPPNNYVCTTAIKAYGRLGLIDEALGLLDWFENFQGDTFENKVANQADGYFLTALLYVCAKSDGRISKPITRYIDRYLSSYSVPSPSVNPTVYQESLPSTYTPTYSSTNPSSDLSTKQLRQLIKQRYLYHTKQAEKIFFKEFTKRKIEYTIPMINSLMFMYAKKRDAQAVLKLYEFSKSLGLTCTVITYGVIIKAFLRSNNPTLQSKAFEVLKSLPNLGITPGVEIYNQFLEFYSQINNYKMAKKVLSRMSTAKPQVKPDIVSYGLLCNCFAESRKPKSALLIYYHMRQSNIKPNGFIYMAVLKALSHLRDGRSAFLILKEMEANNDNSKIDSSINSTKVNSKVDSNIFVLDKKYYSMAMFVCIIANQCQLAEKIFYRYLDKYVDRKLSEFLMKNTINKEDSKTDTMIDNNLNNKLDNKLKIKIDKQVKPDVAICSLYLRALLQQKEWNRGLDFYKLMEKGYLFDKPNEQTVVCLLTYQLLEEKYEEANETLSKLLSSSFIKESIFGVYSALAFTLGIFSEQMRKMYREDKQYHDNISADNSMISFDDDSIESFQGSLLNDQDLINNSLDIQLEPKSKRIYYTGEDGNLRIPRKGGLLFSIEALRKLSTIDSFTVQTNFYLELLEACNRCKFNDLTQLLISYRRSKSIKFKQFDNESISKIEDKIINNEIPAIQ